MILFGVIFASWLGRLGLARSSLADQRNYRKRRAWSLCSTRRLRRSNASGVASRKSWSSWGRSWSSISRPCTAASLSCWQRASRRSLRRRSRPLRLILRILLTVGFHWFWWGEAFFTSFDETLCFIELERNVFINWFEDSKHFVEKSDENGLADTLLQRSWQVFSRDLSQTFVVSFTDLQTTGSNSFLRTLRSDVLQLLLQQVISVLHGSSFTFAHKYDLTRRDPRFSARCSLPNTNQLTEFYFKYLV